MKGCSNFFLFSLFFIFKTPYNHSCTSFWGCPVDSRRPLPIIGDRTCIEVWNQKSNNEILKIDNFKINRTSKIKNPNQKSKIDNCEINRASKIINENSDNNVGVYVIPYTANYVEGRERTIYLMSRFWWDRMWSYERDRIWECWFNYKFLLISDSHQYPSYFRCQKSIYLVFWSFFF